MECVLTIVARNELTETDLHQFAPPGATNRIDARAVDILGGANTQILVAVAAEAQAAGFDTCIQPYLNRRKSILICDMDSTIIEQECIDELGRIAGCGDEIAAITESAMRGKLDFDQALTERVARLEGVPAAMVQTLIEEVITISPGATALVQTMKLHGAYTALVSGGFTVFTGPIAEKTGFATHRSHVLEIDENDCLRGRVTPPILGGRAKREALLEFCANKRVSPAHSMAIGDGVNDLAMIEAAGLGIAYRAKPAVRKAADATIDHTDLTAALYFQGYRPATSIA